MTAVTIPIGEEDRQALGVILVAGIVIAAFTEAIASTVLSLGRADIIGDTFATPDEFAWLDVGYTAAKIAGFIIASWLMTLMKPRNLIIASTLVMGAACGFAALTARLDALIVLRALQGLSGGTLLVAGQTLLFVAFPKSRQPVLQAIFAMGAVVAPATIAPVLQGWLIDNYSWIFIFLGVVPVSLVAVGLLLISKEPLASEDRAAAASDWIGVCLIAIASLCLTYVLSQGSRWDWFDEARITALTVAGVVATLFFFAYRLLRNEPSIVDLSPFRSDDFAFAFIVSFVAGAALFGSAFLIPSFAISVLGFTPTDAGFLLFPSGAMFVAALLIAAFAIQFRGLPPFATVPFGILLIMAAMWMLSGSTSESGIADMMPAILLRGLGLGFLFLSITLIAFSKLPYTNLAMGIGLFNTGRQIGGLIGVGGLQTLIDHNVAENISIIGSTVTTGTASLVDRLAGTTTILVTRGMDTISAGRAATSLLVRTIAGQSTVIAFDTAFNAVALLFVVAAPILVTIKIGLHRYSMQKSQKLTG